MTGTSSNDDDYLPDPFKEPEKYADFLFDEVSGTLRDRPEPGKWADVPSRATKADLRDALEAARADFLALRRDLVASDSRFDALHTWISTGSPLPEPWRRHYVRRNDGEGADEVPAEDRKGQADDNR
jgi:hypothetical protein